ncbi:MAG: hypothetical protein WBN22_04480 [Verrucomicrobiia bacterium]
MHAFEKSIYDRLVKAEWIDQVTAAESKTPAGVEERVLNWRRGNNLLEDGEFKLWMFSKLYRELQTGGIISPTDLETLVQLGLTSGLRTGWEKLPPH